MTLQAMRLWAATAAASGLLWAGAAGAVPSAPGFNVSFIATPGAATGDVVVVGDAVFVGVGPFGAGAQSVVRIDSGGTTVLADGFNSLAGIAYDPVNDRLIVGDNAGELAGAATGDTIFEIPDPFGAPGSPSTALGLELLPAGSLPGMSDVILDPLDPTGDTLFVGDASALFPPNGRVLEVIASTGASSVLQSGLGFTAGLAADGDTLYVGELTTSFTGLVSEAPLAAPGSTLAPLAGLPSGEFDLEIAPDGTLLASSGGLIVRIDPSDGSVTTVANGFGFTTGVATGADGVIYALDGFAAPGETDRVWVFTPVPEPGSAMLLGFGLAWVGSTQRRRRH